MRIVNVAGRPGLLVGDGVVDIAEASGGLFPPDVHAVYDRWPEFIAWAAEADDAPVKPLDEAQLGSPAPRPGQVFAIGLNYLDHAEEAGLDASTVTPGITAFCGSRTVPAI